LADLEGRSCRRDASLLELRFGNQRAPIAAAHPSISGRQVQIFRDPAHANDAALVGDGFLLLVTLAPVAEPGGVGLVTAVLADRVIPRRRAARG
jgi:hypothetical protein